jgi:DNA replication protein DnaC
MTASDGILYRMSGFTYLPVCIPDIFLASGLIVKLDDIPKTISLPKIEYKPRTSSSMKFTGRRDYLTKLRAFFNAESDGSHRRKSFLLYGLGGIGKTQICLKFTEEISDL